MSGAATQSVSGVVVVQVGPVARDERGGVADYMSLCHNWLVNRKVAVMSLKMIEGPCFQESITTEGVSPGVISHLIDDLRPSRVVLLHHFSGYGYGNNGVNPWVPHALNQLNVAVGAERTVCVFHEVHVGRAWPWRRSYWYRSGQAKLAGEVAAAANQRFVTSERGMAQLEALGLGEKTSILPVPSNVGEPTRTLRASSRAKVAVLFGGGGKSRAVSFINSYRGRKIAKALAGLGVEEIWDIGKPIEQASIGGATVRHLGYLEREEISTYLQRARYGLLYYPERELKKSGILAAYLAYGIIPINFALEYGSQSEGCYGLGLAIPEPELDACQDDVLEAYSHRSLDTIMARLTSNWW